MKVVRRFSLLIIMALSTQGCVIAAAAGAGALIADEISERDGKFDPLEKAYDGDKTTEPIIDDGIDGD